MADTKKPWEKFVKECNVQEQEESSEEEDMDVTQEESDKTQESSEADDEMDMDFDFDEMNVLDQWGEDDDMDPAAKQRRDLLSMNISQALQYTLGKADSEAKKWQEGQGDGQWSAAGLAKVQQDLGSEDELEEGELPDREDGAPGLEHEEEEEEQEIPPTDRTIVYILACIPLHDYANQTELDRGRMTPASYLYVLVFKSDEDSTEWRSFDYARDCRSFREATWRFDEAWKELYSCRHHCADLIAGIQILWDNWEERPANIAPCINLLHTVPYVFWIKEMRQHQCFSQMPTAMKCLQYIGFQLVKEKFDGWRTDESTPFSTFTEEVWQDFLDEAYKWLGKTGETINQLCYEGQQFTTAVEIAKKLVLVYDHRQWMVNKDYLMDHVLEWLIERMPQQSYIPDDMQVHEILEPMEDEKWLGVLPEVLKVFKKITPEQRWKRTV